MKRTLCLLLIFLISPLCNAGNWYVLNGQTKKIEFDTQLVEEELWNYIPKNSKAQFSARQEYAYQYSFVGKENVLIHGLCQLHPNGKETDFIDSHIMDGGACFFAITYNLKTKKFSKLYTHGVG
jgi:hypothetical protein